MTDHALPSNDMRAFFANRFVQAILLSGLFLQIGIWVRNYAILMFVMDRTNDNPNAVAWISVAEFAPIFIFSFIGGTFADRWRPKLTMVWCDIWSAVSVFAVLLTLIFGSWQAIFFATLVSSILSQFSQPSGMKLFKLHVPESQIQLGMSMYQSLMAIFMIMGPLLGTFVYFRFGIYTAIAIMGVCFLLSAVVLTFLPADRKEAAKEPAHIWQDMIQGFRYVRANRILLTLGGCFAAAGLGLGLITPLGVYIVTEHLSLPKENFQWFTAVNGAAMIIGGGLTIAIVKKTTPQMLLMAGMLVSACMSVLIGNTYLLWLALAGQFLTGLVLPAIQIGINTMILSNSEESFVGRVNGILNPLFMGTMVITMSMAGWLKGTLPLHWFYWITGGLFVLGALLLLPIIKPRPELKKDQPSPA